jgi:hypothetical protein
MLDEVQTVWGDWVGERPVLTCKKQDVPGNIKRTDRPVCNRILTAF